MHWHLHHHSHAAAGQRQLAWGTQSMQGPVLTGYIHKCNTNYREHNCMTFLGNPCNLKLKEILRPCCFWKSWRLVGGSWAWSWWFPSGNLKPSCFAYDNQLYSDIRWFPWAKHPNCKVDYFRKKKYNYFQNANQLYSWCVWPRETNENHCKVDYCTLQLVFRLGETVTNHCEVDYGIGKTIRNRRTIDYCTIRVLRIKYNKFLSKLILDGRLEVLTISSASFLCTKGASIKNAKCMCRSLRYLDFRNRLWGLSTQ